MRHFPFVALALVLIPRVPHAQTFQIDTREGTQLAFDISPDGSTLVIDLLGQLWTLPVTGGDARALTNAVRDRAEDIDPTFSPDGRWIAFQSDRPDGRGVWIVPAAGGTPRLLVPTTDDRAWPAWAPDSRRLALAVTHNDLAVSDLASGRIDTLKVSGPPTTAVREPVWTADGRHILFVNAFRFNSIGGTLWKVADTGGRAVRIGSEGLRALAPALSKDGRLAFFVRDSASMRHHLVLADSGATVIRTIASDNDVTFHRVRFTPRGRLVYHAAGQLWSADSANGARRRIALRARIVAKRAPRSLRSVSFHAPGTVVEARGFRSLELSPDGRRIAMIALDSLWLFTPGERPRAVVAVPQTADELAWSTDGRLAFTAGAERDIYVVDVDSATINRFTALPEQERRPSWSRDRRHMAFIYGPYGWVTRGVRVARADGTRPIDTVAATVALDARDPSGRYHPWDDMGQEVLNWTADGGGVYVFDMAAHKLIRARLQGGADTLPQPLLNAAFLRIVGDSVAIFVRDDQLWRARFDPARGVLDATAELLADIAMYPSVADDGSVLFVSADGLRLRTAGGHVSRLGWPLAFRVPDVEPLLIRSVRVVDPVSGRVTPPRDVFLRNGRVARIANAGMLRGGADVRIVDAAGRFAMPGLIDLHQHIADDVQPRSILVHGVTTARDLGSGLARTAAIRDAIEAGVRDGPRLVLGGFQLQAARRPDLGWNGAFTHAVVDSSAFTRALDMLAAFGAQHVKIRQFSYWSYAARIAQLAHERGMPVTGHVAHPLALIGVSDAKEHVGRAGGYHRLDGFVYDDVVQLFRGAGTAVVPTLAVFATPMRLYDDSTLLTRQEFQHFFTPDTRFSARRFPSPWSAAARRNWARINHVMRAATATFAAGRVRIGAGTDVQSVPWGMQVEMEEMVDTGLSSAEALRAATSNAAEILGAQELGRIAPGYLADIVLLDANPLDDIRNTSRIWKVIANGRVFDGIAAAPPSTSAVVK